MQSYQRRVGHCELLIPVLYWRRCVANVLSAREVERGEPLRNWRSSLHRGRWFASVGRLVVLAGLGVGGLRGPAEEGGGGGGGFSCPVLYGGGGQSHSVGGGGATRGGAG